MLSTGQSLESGLQVTDRQQVEHVLLSFARILRVAKAGERQLDQRLALRFNVLDFLRTDELGLSRIMADLLDPDGAHGQGALFLKTLLRRLTERERSAGMEATLRKMYTAVDQTAQHIRVVTERRIDGDRRIDVSIEIDETRCIAIENKPYAGDQPDQIKDYLAYLQQEYPDRFLLLYLSPAGDPPSGSSMTKDDRETHGDRFLAMPYCVSAARAVSPSDDASCSSYSIADWADDCRAHCDVDRLRWFLLDIKDYVQRTFGGNGAMDDSEQERRRQLMSRLNHELHSAASDDWWLWREPFSDDSDDMLQHVVDRIEDVARKAIPVIDAIEGAAPEAGALS